MQPVAYPDYNIVQEKIKQEANAYDKLPCVVVIHDLPDWRVVYMSARGLEQLGLTLEEVSSLTGEEYHARYFNQEDAADYVPKIMSFLGRNDKEGSITYFQQVRFPGNEDWSWHMSSTKIFHQDAAGNPLYAITTAVPVDPMHHMTAKASRLLEENNFLRRNFHRFSSLTRREKEVLRLISLGKSSGELARELFISVTTAETHRRNVRNKLQANTSYELSQCARAFDLI